MIDQYPTPEAEPQSVEAVVDPGTLRLAEWSGRLAFAGYSQEQIDELLMKTLPDWRTETQRTIVDIAHSAGEKPGLNEQPLIFMASDFIDRKCRNLR